jgi:hypothetical protein
MAYLELFNNVFGALCLLLIILLFTYVAEIQLHGNDIGSSQKNSLKKTEFWLKFYYGWPLMIFVTLCKVQMLYASSLWLTLACS